MISDEEEVERFEITDHDLENEFGQHKRKRMSKNQQIYGIWAQDSDEEEEPARAGFGGKKTYATRVDFVLGGVQQAGKPKTDAAGASSTGIIQEEEEEIVVVTKKPRKQPEYAGLGSTEMAGFRGTSSSTKETAKVASWEKYTKGIGSKLLRQMGYQPGKGLGPKLQGIATPVEVHKRQGRGAIGAYGVEKGQRLADSGETMTTHAGAAADAGPGAWKKGGAVRKKVKYVYRSVEEVIETGKNRKIETVELSDVTQVKVIDMRGKEQRILSGYGALRHDQQRPEDETASEKLRHKHFDLPELMHNLDLLVDMAEEDLVRLDKKSNHAYDKIAALEKEEESLTQVIEEEEAAMQVLNELLDVVDAMEERCVTSDGESLTPEKIEERLSGGLKELKKAKSDHTIEFRYFQLHHLAVPVVFPLVKKYLQNWQPLEDSEYGMEIFTDAQEVLDEQESNSDPNDNVYYKLIWECWMPRLRAAVSIWDPRKCEKLLRIFEAWHDLVPRACWQHILEAVVLPKLQAAVDEWDPLSDTVPIHGWIHPWLPHMGTHLEILYPVVRQKLGEALSNWHPADRSARLMLTPWFGVWSKGSMDAFLLRHIVPKLHTVFLQLNIAPGQEPTQQQFAWVTEWVDLIPMPIFSAIYLQSFFPRWTQTLSHWLNHGPPKDQVSKWYITYKSFLPPAVQAVHAVQDFLRQALEMMQRSVAGAAAAAAGMPPQMVPGIQPQPVPIGIGMPPPPPSYPPTIEQRMAQERQRQLDMEVLAEAVRARGNTQEGFKDLLARRCHERGIVYYPIPNRSYEAKQVYLCGKRNLYIDKNVIFMMNDHGVWTPVSLQDALDAACQ